MSRGRCTRVTARERCAPALPHDRPQHGVAMLEIIWNSDPGCFSTRKCIPDRTERVAPPEPYPHARGHRFSRSSCRTRPGIRDHECRPVWSSLPGQARQDDGSLTKASDDLMLIGSSFDPRCRRDWHHAGVRLARHGPGLKPSPSAGHERRHDDDRKRMATVCHAPVSA